MGLKTYKQFRNFYFWSEGKLRDDEKDPEIIIEISGNAPYLEYFIGAPKDIGVIGKVETIGNVENVENVDNVDVVPTPTDPIDPYEQYKNLTTDKKLYFKTSQGLPLILFSCTDEPIPAIYTLNNASNNLLLPIFTDQTTFIAFLPLGIAYKYFPDTTVISQNNTGISYSLLKNADNINYIASYNNGQGSMVITYTYTNFADLLKYLVEKYDLNLHIKEIGDNLVVMQVEIDDQFSTAVQMFGKSGRGSYLNITKGITCKFTGINYPKTFQYKNTSYANSYNAQGIVVTKGLQYQKDDEPLQQIADTSINNTTIQAPIFKLWD